MGMLSLAGRWGLTSAGLAAVSLRYRLGLCSRDQYIQAWADLMARHLDVVWPADFTAAHNGARAADALYSGLRHRLADNDLWRHGPARQRMELQLMLELAAGRIDFADARFLDIGCGGRHPFGISTLAVALGAESCTATDLAPILDEARSAAAVLDLMAAVMLNPTRILGSAAPPPEVVSANLHRRFDVAELESGKLLAASRGGIEHRQGSFFDLDFPRDYFTIAHSHTVLEHIPDMDAFTKKLYSITAPGGWGYHLIDLRDHRAYDHAHRFQWWNFMKRAEHDDDATRPGVLNLCNRLRAPDHVRIFESAGFEVVDLKRQCEPIPPNAIEQFEPAYQALSEEDRTTSIVQLLTRKPI